MDTRANYSIIPSNVLKWNNGGFLKTGLTIIQKAVKLSGFLILAITISMQSKSSPADQDPGEPATGKPAVTLPPAPAGVIARTDVDQKSLRETIQELVSCGTRSSISSWDDPKRGIGCGRDKIVARFNAIAKASGGRLQVVDDKFQATSPRTNNKPAPMENVYAILPGSDEKLAKIAIVVSGHFDSMPSNIMDVQAEAPGADDDASGAAVSIECARLLAGGTYRATLLFATVSGEEQGLLGGTRLLEYLRQNGYTVGAMLVGRRNSFLRRDLFSVPRYAEK